MIFAALKRRNLARCAREVNHITVRSPRIRRPLTLALAADLHDGPFEALLPHMAGCDAILIVGDLIDRHSGGYEQGLRFLQAAPEIAPTFYAIGNHEWRHPRIGEYWPHVEKSNVTVLDDRFVPFDGIVLGGLSARRDAHQAAPFLEEMAGRQEFRLLMCHHPEYFARLVQPYDIDLTVSGHAHGGQVRLGRQGVYAPGQGLFPALTSGFYEDGRLLVSRGLTNATWAPRIHCPCELIILHLEAADDGQGT